ncbi:MAG: DUF4276 family protein [Phycisphaerales bacterium]|nr:DUF4276 family protein [Phycisphaerales bacterium]
MSKVWVLVEGETELAFVEQVLAPCLSPGGVEVQASRIGAGRGRSGIGTYDGLLGEITKVLQRRDVQYCTTMFDYYGLPGKWPGLVEARKKTAVADKAKAIEERLSREVSKALGAGCEDSHFIPHVQMHEFEAMLFSDPKILADSVDPGNRKLEQELLAIRNRYHAPEKIDDGRLSAPSKRLQRLIPTYDKRSSGPVVVQRIGLPAIRSQCPHFDAWIRRMESLGPKSSVNRRRKRK